MLGVGARKPVAVVCKFAPGHVPAVASAAALVVRINIATHHHAQVSHHTVLSVFLVK